MSTERQPTSTAGGHDHSLARRSIGFWEALAMSIEAMGPLLGALAVAPLIVSQAGFSAPFMVIVGGLAMLMVALTIGRFSRILPGSFSFNAWTERSRVDRWRR